ncbi:CPBP family intramembrane metalloprotease [Paenibacillus sp. SYP-B3998]|uniref:CPBP family intramembrane metalloprotease n=1 Tax=Paenibacillus sp. SYP-B3998 TaxID=2678564 RepID=A0A6G3ZVU5_9BACL|nr:CPBP family intramembrane glutamic endopeptidase [Paenibacillus sp. SYP-B3998]NEW06252.1 CPBP family intramembrane metalloprotease [Paenibacillus sp. SYP-B3998]
MNDRKGVGISILSILGKVMLCVVFIVIITVILSIAAAVLAIARQPALEMSMDAVARDAFFIKAALWAQIIGFIGGVVINYAIFERRQKWPLGLYADQLWRKMGEGFAAGIILISASCGLIWLVGGVKIVSIQWNGTIAQEMIGGFLLFIGVAVNEELFARGYLQGLVKNRFGTIASVIVSTIVFAFLHSFNPGMWSTSLPIINLLLAGLLFGVSRVCSGGLWMPIGMHLSWNFLQGNVFGFDVSGTRVASIIQIEQSGTDLLAGGSFGAEGSLVTTLILLAGTFLVYVYYHRINLKNHISV